MLKNEIENKPFTMYFLLYFTVKHSLFLFSQYIKRSFYVCLLSNIFCIHELFSVVGYNYKFHSNDNECIMYVSMHMLVMWLIVYEKHLIRVCKCQMRLNRTFRMFTKPHMIMYL